MDPLEREECALLLEVRRHSNTSAGNESPSKYPLPYSGTEEKDVEFAETQAGGVRGEVDEDRDIEGKSGIDDINDTLMLDDDIQSSYSV